MNLDYRLISEIHNTPNFTCGNGSLDAYLPYKSVFDFYERKASTTVVFYEEEPIGFFTLSNTKLAIGSIQRDFLIINNLGVSITKHAAGIGSVMLKYIINAALATNERYIALEALKDDNLELIQWYKNRGFELLETEDILESDIPTVWMYMDLLDEQMLGEFFAEP